MLREVFRLAAILLRRQQAEEIAKTLFPRATCFTSVQEVSGIDRHPPTYITRCMLYLLRLPARWRLPNSPSLHPTGNPSASTGRS